MNVSKDGQLILVGLVLLADDEGRELAHPRLLSREIDYPPEQIEVALAELVENDLIVLYQAGKHCYYSLTRWNQWQSISSQKMTPSKYPAPSVEGESQATSSVSLEDQDVGAEHFRHMPEVRREILGNAGSPQGNVGSPQGNSGNNRENPTQYKLSESNSSESKLIEDEGQPPPNVVTFPTARDAEDNADSYPSEEILQATKQVAAILKLSASDALARVVDDYLHNPGMSLFGEADAAREWIEDRQRNRKQQRLTPAFFRRWLKREQESCQRSLTRSLAPPGLSASLPTSAGQCVASGAGTPGSNNVTDNPYHTFVEQRARALLLRTKGDDYAQTS